MVDKGYMATHLRALSLVTRVILLLVPKRKDTCTREMHALFLRRWGRAQSPSCVCFFSVTFSLSSSLCQNGIFQAYISEPPSNPTQPAFLHQNKSPSAIWSKCLVLRCSKHLRCANALNSARIP